MSKVPLISPLLTPPGIIYFKHALGGGGALGKMVVLALDKKLERKVKKLKYKKFEVMQPRNKNKSELSTRE